MALVAHGDALPFRARHVSRAASSCAGRRSSGPRGPSGLIVVLAFVLGVIETDNAKKVEASGRTACRPPR